MNDRKIEKKNKERIEREGKKQDEAQPGMSLDRTTFRNFSLITLIDR